MKDIYLSKTDFMNFLKHPALLWLSKHDKGSLPPVSESLQAIFDAGNEVDRVAQKLFPEGVLIQERGEEAEKATRQAIEAGTPTIFQAYFRAPDDTLCKVDVLRRVSDTAFELHEVKQTGKVKPEHYPDLAFQKHVLEQCGVTVKRCVVTCLDTTYERDGEIDPGKMFKTEDVTEDVARAGKEVESQIKKALEVLHLQECPDQSPRHGSGQRFDDYMEAYFHLHPDLDAQSIYRMSSLTPEAAALLEDRGYETIDQIADLALAELSASQRKHVESARKPVEVNKPAVKKFLDSLDFPLYFLDYETVSHAIPVFDGTRPYEPVPFQYSLHRLDEPDGELAHFEFLARDQSLPINALAEQLQQDIGPFGSVLVYTGYEMTQNTNMAKALPEHRQFFELLNGRCIDFSWPFSKGLYTHPGFKGRYSIKAVLPVLTSEVSYDGLAIKEGSVAMTRWRKTVFGEDSPAAKEKVFEDLLAYCKLDTLAMVRIYEHLRKVCHEPE